jgi:hypothetical protein
VCQDQVGAQTGKNADAGLAFECGFDLLLILSKSELRTRQLCIETCGSHSATFGKGNPVGKLRVTGNGAQAQDTWPSRLSHVKIRIAYEVVVQRILLNPVNQVRIKFGQEILPCNQMLNLFRTQVVMSACAS